MTLVKEKCLSEGTKNLTIFFCILSILFIAYLPAFCVSYAFHDDYYYLYGGDRSHHLRDHPFFLNSLYSGRFIGAFMAVGYDLLVQTVEDLNLLRLISLFYLSVSAFICYLWTRPYFNNKFNSFLFSLTIFTLPPFQTLVSRGVGVYAITPILVTILAAYWAGKASYSKRLKMLLTNKYAIGAVMTLLFALMVHQAAAMFYWVMTALLILPEMSSGYKAFKQRVINFFCIGLSSIFIYGLILVFSKSYISLPSSALYNPFVVSKIDLGKIKWFLTEPLFNSLNLWDIFPTIKNASLVIFFILFTCLMYILRTFNKSSMIRIFFNVFVFTALILLSFLPNLLSTFRSSVYRCCVALTSMVLIILLLAFNYWISFFPKHRQKFMMTFILMLGCFYGIYKANYNVLEYRVIPNYLELEYLKKTLQAHDLTKYQRILIVMPSKYKTQSPSRFRYDEFGVTSTYFFDDIPFVLKCALNEIGMEASFIIDTHWILRCQVTSPETRKEYYHYFHIDVPRGDKYSLVDETTLIIDMNKIDGFNMI